MDDVELLAPDDEVQRREVLVDARHDAKKHHEELPEHFKQK
jgi:hypothetical protein